MPRLNITFYNLEYVNNVNKFLMALIISKAVLCIHLFQKSKH